MHMKTAMEDSVSFHGGIFLLRAPGQTIRRSFLSRIRMETLEDLQMTSPSVWTHMGWADSMVREEHLPHSTPLKAKWRPP